MNRAAMSRRPPLPDFIPDQQQPHQQPHQPSSLTVTSSPSSSLRGSLPMTSSPSSSLRGSLPMTSSPSSSLRDSLPMTSSPSSSLRGSLPMTSSPSSSQRGYNSMQARQQQQQQQQQHETEEEVDIRSRRGLVPMPDYDDDDDEQEDMMKTREWRSSVKFVNNFQNIISNIRTIEDLYACLPEPVPDYQADDDDDDNNAAAVHDVTVTGNDDASSFPPPPPPLTAEELSSAVSAAYDASVQVNVPVAVMDGGSNPGTNGSADPPLIMPKPLHNPCLESRERQALHKELVLNYKIGKDVLQKPELNKVLRERKATQKKKEWEEYQHSRGRNSLEVKLEERANRMKEEEDKKMNLIAEEEQTPELLRMHRRITSKPGKTGPHDS